MMRWIEKSLEAVAVMVLAASTAMVCLNVVYRYLALPAARSLAAHTSWGPLFLHDMTASLGGLSGTAAEIPGYGLVWVAFLGGCLVMYREGHIAFDVLINHFPELLKKLVGSLFDVALAVMFADFCYQSVRMIQVGGSADIATAEIAQGWFMLIMPFSMGLMSLLALCQLWRRWGTK